MALWHNWPHRVNSNKQAAERWMDYMWREYQWIRVVTQAFIIDLWCQKQTLTLYTATSVTQTQWCPAADKKNVPMQHWRWGKEEWGVDISPKITFLCGESCFLVVHWVPDLPKLTWQDPPTGAWDNAPRLRQPMAPSPNVPVRVTGVLK